MRQRSMCIRGGGRRIIILIATLYLSSVQFPLILLSHYAHAGDATTTFRGARTTTTTPTTTTRKKSLLKTLRTKRPKNHYQQEQQQQNPALIKRNIRQQISALQIQRWKSIRLYMTCIGIVFLWITTGTIFYYKFYDWPLSQSFFYAVDAGMSIGFCTDVAETKVASKAFTIFFILSGSSCVGGALSLFIRDVLERIDEASTREYKLILEQYAFHRADKDNTGKLSRDEFRALVQQWYTIVDDNHDNHDDVNNNDDHKLNVDGNATVVPGNHKLYDNSNATITGDNNNKENSTSMPSPEQASRQLPNNNNHHHHMHYRHHKHHFITEEQFEKVWNKFDRSKTGIIRYKDFIGRYRGIHKLVDTSIGLYSPNIFIRITATLWEGFKSLWGTDYRIYTVFCLWMLMGVVWGNQIQQWDIITSIHFATSALATGGLTAPQTNTDTGILPAGAAIFCGVFCLFGIPLYFCMLGHFATVLVQGQISSREQLAISKPLTMEEYEVAKHLCTANDSVVHLSDYIILQFLRQGKTTLSQLELIKKQFELLDSDRSGILTLQEATTTTTTPTNTNCTTTVNVQTNNSIQDNIIK